MWMLDAEHALRKISSFILFFAMIGNLFNIVCQREWEIIILKLMLKEF